MIYILTFVSTSNIGWSPLIGAQLNSLDFARTWRAYRRLDKALIQKRFYEEATNVFYTANTFQLCSFKALGQYLAHIGPEAAGLIRSLHVQAKRDDPFPTICHLSIATGLKHLHVEAYVYIHSLGEARAVLKNAIEVLLHGHDEIDFDYELRHPRLPTIDKPPTPKEITAMVNDCNTKIRVWSVPRGSDLEKLYKALQKFVAKKRNGEWTAYVAYSFLLLLLTDMVTTCRRRMKYTTNPDHMYKHVMDGTLKNYGWRLKGIKHYYDAPSKAPRQTWSHDHNGSLCPYCLMVHDDLGSPPSEYSDGSADTSPPEQSSLIKAEE